MPKNHNFQALINLDDAPVTRKKEKTPKRLGIINQNTRVRKNFKIHIDAAHALEELRDKLEKKSNVKFSDTKIIELLLLGAVKSPSTAIKWMKA